MKKLIKNLIVILFLGLAASAYAQPQEGQRDYASGEALYQSRCLFCHGVAGDGNGPGASVLNPRPGNFTAPDFWKGTSNEKISQTIMSGHGKGMPAFRFLPEDVKAVVDYISRFKKDGEK
jgi:mono/diheme cytochrome c family protein